MCKQDVAILHYLLWFKGSSINVFTKFWTSFYPLLPIVTLFYYEGFITVVTKSLTPFLKACFVSDFNFCLYFCDVTGECERQLKFPCKYSVVCGVAGSKFLCNKTKHLCIDLDDVCNDVNDCMEGDNSDESRCKWNI